MSAFWLMHAKEWKESLRSYRLIWLPVVFLILGISQPLTMYYMEDLLQAAGGLPEGAVFSMPEPSAGEVIASVQGQFNQIGVLVLVLAFMGQLSGERKAQTDTMILARPVSWGSFAAAKGVHVMGMAAFCYGLGTGAAVYYTSVLYGTVPFHDAISAAGLFLLWLLLVSSLLLLFQVLFASGTAAGFVTIASALLLSLGSSFFAERLPFLPGRLSSVSSQLWMQQPVEGLLGTVLSGAGLSIGLFFCAVYLFHRRSPA
ncbi:ABC transporter permease [Alkalicoccus urumqiensis]|uniref:ABC transporter permease n=1 Tax=Alkalicoccus urumqiensis TaxID=1548213 RepID=A0A2P6MDC6_ALKUR|nr:ABC transporter permease [Alkalicoccus urumqiensis]PRO64291.1 ABC transporter permease [Alkalicoccus urumqiensis]